jgi:hypothetical protein
MKKKHEGKTAPYRNTKKNLYMKPQATHEIHSPLVISYPFSFYVPASDLFGLLNTNRVLKKISYS